MALPMIGCDESTCQTYTFPTPQSSIKMKLLTTQVVKNLLGDDFDVSFVHTFQAEVYSTVCKLISNILDFKMDFKYFSMKK